MARSITELDPVNIKDIGFLIRKLKEIFLSNIFTRSDIVLRTIKTDGAVTNLKVPHGLGYTPTDIIETSLNGGTVTWVWNQFSDKDIVITTSAAVDLRFLLGRL